jgi:hypothetical protein
MADILCSQVWHEPLGIIVSVCIGFLYIWTSIFVFFRCIVRSRKFMALLWSFSIVNFILVCCLLQSVIVSSMFVLGCRLLGCHRHI